MHLKNKYVQSRMELLQRKKKKLKENCGDTSFAYEPTLNCTWFVSLLEYQPKGRGKCPSDAFIDKYPLPLPVNKHMKVKRPAVRCRLL